MWLYFFPGEILPAEYCRLFFLLILPPGGTQQLIWITYFYRSMGGKKKSQFQILWAHSKAVPLGNIPLSS